MMLLTSLVTTLLLLWMVSRLWRANATLAIVSMVLWPVMLFALMRYWDDEEVDIKVPFLLFAPAAAYTYYLMFSLPQGMLAA